MDKATRLNFLGGLTRIDAPVWVSIILLLLGMSILDRPGTAIIPLMVQFGFPVNEYAIGIVLCGIVAVIARNKIISVFVPLVMIPYIWYTYWYYHLQPSAPINAALGTAVMYFCLMVFMCRSQALYFQRYVTEEPETYLEHTVCRLSSIPARTLVGIVMILLGILVHSQPVGGVIAFAINHDINVRLFGWWLIVFGFIRLRRFDAAWDVILVLPLLYYCVLTFTYLADQPMATRNPILGILYVSLFIYTLRANLSGRG